MKITVRVQSIGGEIKIYDMTDETKRQFDFASYGLDPYEVTRQICDLVKAKPSDFEIPQLIGLNII